MKNVFLFVLLSLFLWSNFSLAQEKQNSVDISAYLTAQPLNPNAKETIWDVLFNYNLQALSNGSLGKAGVCYIPTLNQIWVSYWNTAVSNYILNFTPGGTLIDSFLISGVVGVRSFTFDGQFVYTSHNTTTIRKIDPVTRTVVATITAPQTVRYLSFDPNANGGSGGLWLGNLTTNLQLISLTGTVLKTWAYSQLGNTNIYGAAFDNVSIGGPFLWLWGQGAGGGTPQMITQLNPATGLPTGLQHDVKTDVGLGNSQAVAGGLNLSSDIFNGRITLIGILQGAPDRLFAYEVGITGPYVMITSPNGGEEWVGGTSQAILWSSNGVNNVKIEYTTNGGVNWSTIITSTSASLGNHNWTIPNTPSTNCKVRISSIENPSINDESNGLFKIMVSNHTVTVSNVTFTQRNDGSFKVDVYYDVNDGEGNVMTVTMKVSDDNGATWNYRCNNITGDVGTGIMNGTNKHIVWDFAAEHPQTFGDQFRIKIIADDGIAGSTCAGIPTVSYAGKTYNTVQIGNQCWLKENLDVGEMIYNTQNPTNNGIIEKYCYNNVPNNCNTYGGLYQWDEAMQYVTTQGTRGICPTGWHVPTYNQLQTLVTAVNNNGNALKALGQGSGAGAGTNASGFSALLTGGFTPAVSFINLGIDANIWSSAQNGSMDAFNMYLVNNNSNIEVHSNGKIDGYSVRCLKD